MNYRRLRAHMSDVIMADGFAKNLQVMRQQVKDYYNELAHIVFPDIKDAIEDRDILEVLHKLTAIFEEAFDKMPRWFAYGTIIWLGYKAAGLAGLY